jgi:DNA-binding Lrp family transcriptional regulator
MIPSPQDRRLLAALAPGLPLVPDPWAEIGGQVGLSAEEAMAAVRRLMAAGAIRRIGAATNHFALGLTANGMTVWDVDDAAAETVGAAVGALDFVTHCYLRPRALPDWPYNLFAMVHGRSREEVEAHRAAIAAIAGPALRASDVLYSTRILKKTGMRLGREGGG